MDPEIVVLTHVKDIFLYTSGPQDFSKSSAKIAEVIEKMMEVPIERLGMPPATE